MTSQYGMNGMEDYYQLKTFGGIMDGMYIHIYQFLDDLEVLPY